MYTFNLKNGIAYEVCKGKYGNNSTCFIVNYSSNKYLLKIMSKNSDKNIQFDFMPKLIEQGKIYFEEKCDYRLYEFIDGINLVSKITIDICMLRNLLSIPYKLHQSGYCFNDINPSNFIYSNGVFFLVDYGAISEIENVYNKSYYQLIYNYTTSLFPEEQSIDRFDPLDEKIAIYYFGLMIKDCCIIIDEESRIILNKMTLIERNGRYSSFEEVYLDSLG